MLSTDAFEDRFLAFRTTRDVQAMLALAVQTGDANLDALTVPGAAVAGFAAEHGARLASKFLIDTTNNMRGATLHNVDAFTAQAPNAIQVRAFNALGWENLAAPAIAGVQTDLFYCGDPSARAAADQLIADVGLRPISVGGLDATATVDGMARLWFALAFGQGRQFAVKLLAE